MSEQNNRFEAKEAINYDAYLSKCECPSCGKSIFHDGKESIKYCEKCGQKLHMRALTEEEIEEAVFEHQMDEYED